MQLHTLSSPSDGRREFPTLELQASTRLHAFLRNFRRKIPSLPTISTAPSSFAERTVLGIFVAMAATMSKDATAAVASVLMLLALFLFAQLDPSRGLSFRGARAIGAEAAVTSARLATADAPSVEPCKAEAVR